MKLVFIVNDKSGNGNGAIIWKKIKSSLSVPFEIYQTTYEKQAIEFAVLIKEQAKQMEEPILLIGIGGDGTYHEILNGLVGANNIILGAVCAGSGNDFKRAYKQFESAGEIESFLKNPIYLLQDIGELKTGNSSIRFVNNSGIGFDATVAIAANESKVKNAFNKVKLGKLSYVYYLIKCLFTFKPFDMIVEHDGVKTHYSKVWFVTASNQQYFGGGMKISPLSNTNDNLLELTVVQNLNKYKLLLIFGTVFLGKHNRFKEVIQLQSSEFIIHMQENYFMHADGEKLQIETAKQPMIFTIAKDKWHLAKM